MNGVCVWCVFEPCLVNNAHAYVALTVFDENTHCGFLSYIYINHCSEILHSERKKKCYYPKSSLLRRAVVLKEAYILFFVRRNYFSNKNKNKNKTNQPNKQTTKTNKQTKMTNHFEEETVSK